jgi:gluconolactonase
LPEVEKKKTSDGRPIVLSKNGNDRGIGGSSSGAIAAFTAAWERPDSFSRVFSAIGTYVGLRGGNIYPTLIRKFEPKPIRVFLQDGSADQNVYGGDWWMANQEMERALKFAGYEVNHAWGDGGHDGKHATKIFPEAMRWLWKDWPTPVKGGFGSQQLREILIPGEDWKLLARGYAALEGMAANAKGEVFFNGLANAVPEKTYRIGLDSQISALSTDIRGFGLAFGPDGLLLVAARTSSAIEAYDDSGKFNKVVVADFAEALVNGRDHFRGHDLVAGHNGSIYVTAFVWEGDLSTMRKVGSKVWHISPKGVAQIVETGLNNPTGVTLSPDQSLLYVAESGSHWVFSYQIQPNGTLANKQRYYHLHAPDTADDSGAQSMCVDRDGRLYVATRMGIQVCDQAGRVNCILPPPNGQAAHLCFGGASFDTLFITCGDRIYQRKLKTKGGNAFQAPSKPAPPRL